MFQLSTSAIPDDSRCRQPEHVALLNK